MQCLLFQRRKLRGWRLGSRGLTLSNQLPWNDSGNNDSERRGKMLGQPSVFKNAFREEHVLNCYHYLLCKSRVRLIWVQVEHSTDGLWMSLQLRWAGEFIDLNSLNTELGTLKIFCYFLPFLPSQSGAVSQITSVQLPANSAWIRMIGCSFTQSSPNHHCPNWLTYIWHTRNFCCFLPVWLDFMAQNYLVQGKSL